METFPFIRETTRNTHRLFGNINEMEPLEITGDFFQDIYETITGRIL